MGAAEDTFTWEENPASRATLAMLGNASVEDGVPNPDKGSKVFAGMLNELQRQVAGTNRVEPAAIVWVRFSSGAPFVYQATGVRSDIATSSFTVTRQSGAPTGRFKIAWLAGKLPPLLADPEVFANSGPSMPYGTLDPSGPNSVLVWVYDNTGTLADNRFGVKIY